MKKYVTGLLLTFLMLSMTACGGDASEVTSDAAQSAASEPAASTSEVQTQGELAEDTYVAKVASMKGPTSMGLAHFICSDTTDFTFEMFTEGSEIVPLMVKGEMDIALIPANLAATLYQKTEGGIQVIGINTLGVLEVVAPTDMEIDSFDDLTDKTIYMTGKGTTPESAVRYLADKHDLTDLTIEFQSEATAVVSMLAANPDAVAILPQPFATVATVQNADMEIKLSLTDVWSDVAEDGSSLVTGVTVARTAFIEEHPQRLEQFLEEAAVSVEYVDTNVEEAAALVESLDIVKAVVGKQAIPRCNLVSVTGEEMQTALSGYLTALHTFDPSLVGGQIPDEAFYYIP